MCIFSIRAKREVHVSIFGGWGGGTCGAWLRAPLPKVSADYFDEVQLAILDGDADTVLTMKDAINFHQFGKIKNINLVCCCCCCCQPGLSLLGTIVLSSAPGQLAHTLPCLQPWERRWTLGPPDL
jgi:hypothetical protein